MTTARERAHTAAVNAGEAHSVRQAERLADLELSPLADALKVSLRVAQDVLESCTATEDEKRLAERLLDACGPADDCFMLAESVGE